MSVTRDDFPALVAGGVAVLVGFTSSVALVFQAAQSLNASAAQTASWIWALGLGTGLTSLFLSWRYRQPVLTAWSTPGAALIAAAPGLTLAEGVGAFVVCGGLIVLAGVTRGFERLMNRIPASIAASLLAGVLARFGLDAVIHAPTNLPLGVGMLLAYLLGRRWWPRYAVPGVLVVGVGLALLAGKLDLRGVLVGGWAAPVWVTPVFSLNALIGLALPLFVVTMASQNLPGVAAQRAAGYDTPISPVVTATGLTTLLLAPFGAFALNLAAITAAICMGREAHEDPRRRWLASAAAGLFYILVGLAGGAVVALFAAFPKVLVLAVAALALLGAIGNGLAISLKEEGERDAAVLTFLITLSGVQILGIGAPFWAVLVGLLARAFQRRAT